MVSSIRVIAEIRKIFQQLQNPAQKYASRPEAILTIDELNLDPAPQATTKDEYQLQSVRLQVFVDATDPGSSFSYINFRSAHLICLYGWSANPHVCRVLRPFGPCFAVDERQELAHSCQLASDKSLRRHCCRVSAADKGCRVYPLDPRPDAVALYSGCTPGRRSAWFLPDDRHTASLVGLHGG
ncbi:uncharacterized protein TNCV_3356971 [Trichonephila clavipes]|nr:uncharacterized protein TNCV_3356971 [Trichonephila clavipes]